MFGSTKEKLVKKSQGIMSTFTSMVDNLKQINQEAKAEHDLIEVQKQILIQEQKELSELLKQNEKLSRKIEEFLA
jgi:hypothetical protein